jgi:hypothetical protein
MIAGHGNDAVQADRLQGYKHLSTSGAGSNERRRIDRSVDRAGTCRRRSSY